MTRPHISLTIKVSNAAKADSEREWLPTVGSPSVGAPSTRRNPRLSRGFGGTPGETRTPNLLIRSQTLYPIELRAHCGDYRRLVTTPETGSAGRTALAWDSSEPSTQQWTLYRNEAHLGDAPASRRHRWPRRRPPRQRPRSLPMSRSLGPRPRPNGSSPTISPHWRPGRTNRPCGTHRTMGSRSTAPADRRRRCVCSPLLSTPSVGHRTVTAAPATPDLESPCGHRTVEFQEVTWPSRPRK